ncbi:MAG: hypothetical protein SFY80_06485 [Verrucomicrobiota bacterium]|nr:hypothetical protein [Verrucomicrobiota bacterium]
MQKLSSTYRAAVLAFICAFTTLAVQIFVHRIVTVKLLNNYAFFVISLTMLGFAISGVILTKYRAKLARHFNETMVILAAGFVLSLLICSFIFVRTSLDYQRAATYSALLISILPSIGLGFLFTIPFTLNGLILGMLLSDPLLPTKNIYGYDLIGSAMGAVASLLFITWIGVEIGMIGVSLLFCVTTLTLYPTKSRFVLSITIVAIVFAITSVLMPDTFFRYSYLKNSPMYLTQIKDSGYKLLRVEWDPVSRIELMTFPVNTLDHKTYRFPSLIGPNQNFANSILRQLTQNNFAFTDAPRFDGTKKSIEGIEQTIYASAYQASSVNHPKALTIGVGGGMDILTALYFDSSSITGVEINPATLKILKSVDDDYFKPWVNDPRVKLVHAEGRRYLSSHHDQYDIIQLSGVDTYAGTLGAVNIFSENYLYTTEAVQLYWEKLTPEGILNVMRLEHYPPKEMLRYLITARKVLRNNGISNPPEHIAIVSDIRGNFVSVLVKKTPFTHEERKRLRSWTENNPTVTIIDENESKTFIKPFYALVQSFDEPSAEKQFIEDYPFRIYPTTDDTPFFFYFTHWSHFFSKDPWVKAVPAVMESSILVLLVLSGLACLICIFIPLKLLSTKLDPAISYRKCIYYFSAIGIGFMSIELALMQKFSLFLGHPNYAISVVLATMLLASGLGSIFSDVIVARLKGAHIVALLLVLILGLDYFFIFPKLPYLTLLPDIARFSLSVLIIFLPAFLMGIFFPVAIDSIKQSHPQLIPWAWGVNGIFSVMAPIIGMALSMYTSISTLLLLSLPIYLIAGLLVHTHLITNRAKSGNQSL